MQHYRTGLGALCLLLLLAACEQDSSNDGRDDSAAVENEELDDESRPVPVEVATPSRGDIAAVYAGTAPIEAFAEADIVAKVVGEVREILVEEGDTVRRNQVVARLDGDRLRLELNESRARLDKLQRDYDRNRELQEKGIISEGDYEKLRYDLEALQASYNLASLDYDYTQIRSPIAGVVSERFIKIGRSVAIGEALFRVTGTSPLVAYLHVPEREFRQLAAGQPVRIEIDALASESVIASVSRISPTVDAGTGTFKLTVEIENADGRIKPGMFGRLSIVFDVHENVLQIPRSAISERAGGSYVFVVEDGVAHRRQIETGFGDGGMVEVSAGLSDDDQVITLGHVGLKNESDVVVIDNAAGD